MFKNMKLWQKLTTIGLSYSLPIAVLLYFVTTEINRSVDFAQWESYGNEYQRPLEDLLSLLPQHQWLARRFLSGDRSVEVELSIRRSALDKAFEALAGVNNKLGVNLQFTDEGLGKRKRAHVKVENVRSEWQSLESQLSNLQPDVSDEKHSHLVADVKTMITH